MRIMRGAEASACHQQTGHLLWNQRAIGNIVCHPIWQVNPGSILAGVVIFDWRAACAHCIRELVSSQAVLARQTILPIDPAGLTYPDWVAQPREHCVLIAGDEVAQEACIF